MGTEQPRVLVVEDENDLRLNIVRKLAKSEMNVFSCGTGREAVELAKKQNFDCILLDIRLGRESGEQVITAVRADTKGPNAGTPILIMSGSLDKSLILRIGKEVSGILVKPFETATLVEKVKAFTTAQGQGTSQSLATVNVFSSAVHLVQLALQEMRDAGPADPPGALELEHALSLFERIRGDLS